MTQYAIATDLNRCVGCLACAVACKTENGVGIGEYWNKVVRVGPTPKVGGSGQFPDVEMYYVTLQCQHCSNPKCVEVCPTGASYKAENGTVQIDAEKCISCGSCVVGCPYGVRFLNAETKIAEKCTMCVQKIERGELPQCVTQCGGRARFFGDLDKGIESFEGPGIMDKTIGPDYKVVHPIGYEDQVATRVKLKDFVEPFKQSDVYRIDDQGTGPNMLYILRNRKWQGYSDKF